MIGGKDFWIATLVGPIAMEVAIRIIRFRWPAAVFDDAMTGQRYQKLDQLPFAKSQEILVYRDHAAAAEWDRTGASDELRDSMVHIIRQDAGISLTIDESPSAEMLILVKEIELALQRSQFFPRNAA